MTNLKVNLMDAKKPVYDITYIGFDGVGTWIGTVEGLHDMYPNCKLIKIEEHE